MVQAHICAKRKRAFQMTVKPLFVGQQQSTTPAEELSATKSSYIFTQCNHLPPTYESEGYSESYEL